ncbi:aldehyde dehydrogenase [Plantactinospora sp. KBS50]|uniref:aldehyde dehydrogenase family protein n=1 Tax=Plantactinospora sp. KBS50 TaxID=2024580 RepID=UPI000BAB0F86|nr:aldehyde dehydrogenase family protein [Plantactinospora sp. KBS50]ASW55642.1 hypothetical protein CIK06_17830 [Plantactinospora sp. KBS50]
MSLSEHVYDAIDPDLRDRLSRWLDREPAHFIGGARVPARAGRTLPVIDPGTGGVVGSIAAGDRDDVAVAVADAHAAFERWRRLRPSKRAELLMQAAVTLRANIAEIATLESIDTGKPLTDASGEAWWTSDAFRYFAGLANLVDGRTTRPHPGVLAASVREPLGVCAAITAWNFPTILVGFKAAPALSCGNAVVLKPSEHASLATLRIAELLVGSGLPPGLVNVVTGVGDEAGAALVADRNVRAITFTGSTDVGRRIGRDGGARLVPVGLELGGKSPQVVFPDTDLAAAAPALFRGIYQNAGQMCAAGSRIVVHRSIAKDLANRLVELAGTVTVGHGLAPGSTFGPLITERQFDRVRGYVDRAVADGGTVLTGGSRARTSYDGYFFEPTVLSGLDAGHPAVREEIFGPVVVLQEFDDRDEAVRLANETPYGLAAGVWSGDTETALAVAQQVSAGNVWVNGYGIVHPAVPFGGFRDSGVGRDLGPHHLDFYTEEKTIWLGLNGRSI